VAALAVALVASACSHQRNPQAKRVVASPGATAVLTLETPVPSPTPSATSPSQAIVTAPTPTPLPRTTSLADAKVTLTQIASLDQPVAMAVRPGDAALYFAQKTGTVVAIRSGQVDPNPVLDISREVSTGAEQGLLGLAFSPDGSKLYVNFTSKTGSGAAGDTIVREYAFSGGSANTGTARVVLDEPQPYPNHNGGNLVFGPDGYLYIGLGDGGGAGDPMGNGQNLNTRLGKMLRIDPQPGSPDCGSGSYTIPPGNPFVGRAGCAEIWAYGLRNPWRYSFDLVTGDLWIGDVGQDSWEEIDYQPASAAGGDNYGWNRMEGTHPYNGGTPPSDHHAPIYEYSHDGGNCSVVGGYVYRGRRIIKLVGAYVFGDACTGALQAFLLVKGRAADHRFLGVSVPAGSASYSLTSFGQDGDGELYAMSLGGAVYRIDPA
jgi:glucose/arabinose dehydrogenase